MTVAELIDYLRQFPQELLVVIHIPEEMADDACVVLSAIPGLSD